MNLDKELEEIARPERMIHEREAQKTSINNRFKRAQTIQLRTQKFVMSCIAVLFLLFYFENDINETSQQAALTDQPIEITVLENQIPERELNLNSPMYFQKESTKDAQLLEQFHLLLIDESVSSIPWAGEIVDRDSVTDILLTFENGKQYYLKYSSEGLHRQLIDTKERVSYILPDKIGENMYELLIGIENQNNFEKWKLLLLLIFPVFLIIDLVISRKFILKDETGRRKKGSSLLNVLLLSLFIIPLHYGEYFFGAKHGGLIILGMSLGYILGEYFDVRLGVKQPNWKWAFSTMTITIVFFLLTLL